MELRLRIEIETTPDAAAGETDAEGDRLADRVQERFAPLVAEIVRDAEAEGVTVELSQDGRDIQP